MLLQDALGGNTKTVMITCIPQHMRASGEISTALMWSARSRTIQNRAVRNIDSGGDSELAVLSRQVQDFKRSLLKRAKDMECIDGSSDFSCSVQALCDSVPEETQQIHEALKAVMNGHNMLLEASASKLSGLSDLVFRLSESSTAAEQQIQEQEQTILRLQHALERALTEKHSMRRVSDQHHDQQEQAAKIARLEAGVEEARRVRDEVVRSNAMVAARDAEIEELRRKLEERDAELRNRLVQQETVTMVLDKFVQDNMLLQEQLMDAHQENSASAASRRSSRTSLSSISSSIRFSLESASRGSTGRRSSLYNDADMTQPLLQDDACDQENQQAGDDADVIECKNLDTGCIERISVAKKHGTDSFGKRRRSSEASDENAAPGWQSSPGKLDLIQGAKQVTNHRCVNLAVDAHLSAI
jgi:chromosome segregation ATPase